MIVNLDVCQFMKINHLHVEYTVNPQAGYVKEQGIIHVQFFVGLLIAGKTTLYSKQQVLYEKLTIK